MEICHVTVSKIVINLIDGTLSMVWADYRKCLKKAKVHVGFDLNRSIPRKVHLTDGNDAERPFVSKLLYDGQTGILDRGYKCHELFELVRYYGYYSNVSREKRKKQDQDYIIPPILELEGSS